MHILDGGTISGETFLQHTGPCVYAWKRGEDYLYVSVE